jgi:hypothetical protein
MQTSVFADQQFPNDWHVETIDGATGDIYQAVFSGPDAESKAREYAERSEREEAVPAPADMPTQTVGGGLWKSPEGKFYTQSAALNILRSRCTQANRAARELAPHRKDMKVLDVSCSDFEGTLFNLITLRNFPGKKRVVFSGRMAIAKAMTDTLLKEQEKHAELGSASPAPIQEKEK